MKVKQRWNSNLVSSGEKEKIFAARSNMASLLSNTKWRKLFIALDRPDLRLDRCLVKFVDVEQVREMGTPTQSSFRGTKYFETSFTPEPFVAIEWLEWPDIILEQRGKPGVPPAAKAQDTGKARTIIEALGRFPLQITETGLRIVGHARQPLD